MGVLYIYIGYTEKNGILENDLLQIKKIHLINNSFAFVSKYFNNII